MGTPTLAFRAITHTEEMGGYLARIIAVDLLMTKLFPDTPHGVHVSAKSIFNIVKTHYTGRRLACRNLLVVSGACWRRRDGGIGKLQSKPRRCVL